MIVDAPTRQPIRILVHGGAGRMGRVVTALACATEGIVVRGVLDLRRRAHKGLEECPVVDHISGVTGDVDVVVDFSHPAALGPLVTALAGTGIRLVSGTTGLAEEERTLLKNYSQEAAVLYDENMSYGISVMKRLLSVAAPLWRGTADVEIVETHRRGKRDYPSGTAHALARALDPGARLVSGRGVSRVGAERMIHSHSLRLGGVVGDHEVYFAAEDEVMTVSHRALSREVFARGALHAVRFVVGKPPGMYSMDDLTEA
jgi:4-hydroxy-tetrahydrodipicolinate reductase